MDVVEGSVFRLGSDDIRHLDRILGGLLERRREGWAITRIVGHVELPSGKVLRITSPKASVASAWVSGPRRDSRRTHPAGGWLGRGRG